jgi:hypothetical protein
MSKPRNSFEAVKFVLDHAPKDLTLTQRAVLTQIAHHYPTPHLSQKTLAAEIGARRVDTVNRAVQALVKRDLLIVKRQGQARANKYELNYGSNVYGETASMTTRQTAYHVYGQTVLKQTNNKKENKETFFDFMKNFPEATVSEDTVFRAYNRALTKGVTDDELITASRTNREMLEPDAWLNFEKWKSYKPEVDEIAMLREMSI